MAGIKFHEYLFLQVFNFVIFFTVAKNVKFKTQEIK